MQLAMKNWFHHLHLPVRGDLMLRTGSLVRSRGFWTVLILASLVLLLLGFGIWASINQTPFDQRYMPPYIIPYVPYM